MHRTAKFAAFASLVLIAPITLRAQDLPESSPQALMHHAQGVDAYVKGNNADAIKHFTLAYESDNTSYVSLFMAGVAAWLGLSVWPSRAQTSSRPTSYGTQDRELWAG